MHCGRHSACLLLLTGRDGLYCEHHHPNKPIASQSIEKSHIVGTRLLIHAGLAPLRRQPAAHCDLRCTSPYTPRLSEPLLTHSTPFIRCSTRDAMQSGSYMRIVAIWSMPSALLVIQSIREAGSGQPKNTCWKSDAACATINVVCGCRVTHPIAVAVPQTLFPSKICAQ
ncbi:hypothetical protein CC78DRAFT_48439 [Lojkania enalia]|uniref:Uncharacterized protein n=1 Tax=Lojkania enalia TaxID=147567 RepID=A0A9P4KGP2_9PLEO|nr:hypothetical protein CC78DRAFT_48439 [Didymosphaeria enalia]